MKFFNISSSTLLLMLCVCSHSFYTLAQPGQYPYTPQMKDPQRHEKFLEIIRSTPQIDVVFLGDSITEQWGTTGVELWQQNFQPLHAVNFGISSDRTEHVLWRCQNGELDGYRAKAIVLLIGTNNRLNSAEDVNLGVEAILKEIQMRQPEAKIFLFNIFPRGADTSDQFRIKNEQVNHLLQGYDGRNNVSVVNINEQFISPDGSLSTDIMHDLLHLSQEGYAIWSKNLQPLIHAALISAF